MRRLISFRDFDWILLGFILAICGLGVLEVYSTTFSTKMAGMHVKQMYWILLGLALMFAVSLVDYHTLLERSHWLWIASVLALVAVLLVGHKALGARRWIGLPGGLHFQPSEWVKLVVILALARYYHEMKQREATLADIFKTGLIAGVPMLLVLVEPDLGTALTYVPIFLMALFLGGLRLKHALVLGMLAVALGTGGWFFVLKEYQKTRVNVFLNPETDPQGKGYQIQQALIAVGSGGIWGKGLTKGTQTQGEFLPMTHTDFAFASFAEEQGFIGACGVLLLYFLVLARLIQNAQTAPDRAGTFIVMGVVAVLTFQVLVNVGMVVRFMPVTGIPLPLMSYGGSSVLFMFLALGLVMNIRMRRFVN